MSQEIVTKKIDLFAYMFLVSQRMQYITDQIFQRENLTTKQWLVTLAIEKGFEYPPSLGEVAELLSTSHQNTRQITNQLEKKGFLEYQKDADDGRILRLKLTEKIKTYYSSKSEEHLGYLMQIFDVFSAEEIDSFHSHIMTLYDHLEPIYSEFRKS